MPRYIEFEQGSEGAHSIVTRIKEKERISTHANTGELICNSRTRQADVAPASSCLRCCRHAGAYGFGSGVELLGYCRQVIDTVRHRNFKRSIERRWLPCFLHTRHQPYSNSAAMRVAPCSRAGLRCNGSWPPVLDVRCIRAHVAGQGSYHSI